MVPVSFIVTLSNNKSITNGSEFLHGCNSITLSIIQEQLDHAAPMRSSWRPFEKFCSIIIFSASVFTHIRNQFPWKNQHLVFSFCLVFCMSFLSKITQMQPAKPNMGYFGVPGSKFAKWSKVQCLKRTCYFSWCEIFCKSILIHNH